MKLSRKLLSSAIVSVLMMSTAAAQDEPFTMTIIAPGAGVNFDDGKVKVKKVKVKKVNDQKTKTKKIKLKDKNPMAMPVTQFEDGYDLIFRMSVPNAVGLQKWRRQGNNFGPQMDTLILTDPDECLDLSHAVPASVFPNTIVSPFESCPGGQDETFVNFNIDPYDGPNVDDSGGGYCRLSIRDRLITDSESALPEMSNSVYVDPGLGGTAFQVGPNTGFPGVLAGTPTGGNDGSIYDQTMTTFDCFGYGTDDDVPGLVVLADIGAARIFDQDMVQTPGRLRNMAGLLSSVAFEMLDENGDSAIVARMRVDGALNPIRFVDQIFDVINPSPPSTGYSLYTQIDGVDKTTPIVGATTTADTIAAIHDQFDEPYEITIRAFLVDGIAPEIITDVNNDGIFSAADVAQPLLSNEAQITLTHYSYDAIAAQKDSGECPKSTTPFRQDDKLYIDLNGDNFLPNCNDGDGTSQSGARIPR